MMSQRQIPPVDEQLSTRRSPQSDSEEARNASTSVEAIVDQEQSSGPRRPNKNEFLEDGFAFAIVHREGKSSSGFRISKVKKGKWWHCLWQVNRGPKKNLYVGKLDPSFGDVSPTKKSKKPHYIDPLALLNDVLPRIWRDDELPEGIEVLAAVSCEECRGRLTSPQSIARRLGPSCAARLSE